MTDKPRCAQQRRFTCLLLRALRTNENSHPEGFLKRLRQHYSFVLEQKNNISARPLRNSTLVATRTKRKISLFAKCSNQIAGTTSWLSSYCLASNF